MPAHRSSPAIALLAVAAAAVTVATAPPASASSTVARWEMNEPVGATVMTDSTGHGITGKIGSDVQVHKVQAGKTGYAFPYLKNGVPPTHPGHLVTVANDNRLNPGTADYSITMTLAFKSGATGTNVMQKGQSSSPGGYFKLEIDHGALSCLFRGSKGSAAVGTGPISDGAFHTISCARTASAVTMTVDGRVTATRKTATGSISNSALLSIAGKPSCNQTTVQCDYFPGTIDRVQIETG